MDAPTPCERRDVAWLEKLFTRMIEEHEKRTEQRFSDFSRAIDLQETNASHWREQANEWRAAMDDRERNFLPKTMGYLLAGVSVILSIVGFVIDIFKNHT